MITLNTPAGIVSECEPGPMNLIRMAKSRASSMHDAWIEINGNKIRDTQADVLLDPSCNRRREYAKELIKAASSKRQRVTVPDKIQALKSRLNSLEKAWDSHQSAFNRIIAELDQADSQIRKVTRCLNP